MSDARNEFNAMSQGLSGLGYSKKQENNDLTGYEEFVPPSNIQFNTGGEGDDFDYNQPSMQDPNYDNGQFLQPQTREEYNFDRNRPEMPIQHNDEELFPGGPTLSEVESWKKQHTNIYIVDDLPTDDIFIYRTINRYEYKAITAIPNTDPLMREELICEQCVLFPYEYSYGNMANGNAGLPSIVAQHILETSGFTKASMPRRL